MSPTIRIDDQVWAWLKTQAEPLEDTPNTVLRRIAGLDKPSGAKTRRKPVKLYGRDIDKQRGLGSAHALYSEQGNWYDYLQRFPGTYHDAHGYLMFRTLEEYEACRYFNFGKTVNVNIREGISGVPGYVVLN
ncbi:MAG TPA: hypothetical protein VJB57_19605 [Dehalococcoidia bacterium]|nr:hypothetical protein [Dehalococcoidia bacterium]